MQDVKVHWGTGGSAAGQLTSDSLTRAGRRSSEWPSLTELVASARRPAWWALINTSTQECVCRGERDGERVLPVGEADIRVCHPLLRTAAGFYVRYVRPLGPREHNPLSLFSLSLGMLLLCVYEVRCLAS